MKHILTEDDDEEEEARVIRSGESVRVPLLLMDSARRAQIIREASSGNAGVGYRRGFQFAGPCIIDDAKTIAARDAATAAYEARKERLTNAWRDRKQHQNHQPPAAAAPPAPLAPPEAPRSLADARALADEAYRRKVERLSRRPR
jgi:hypothetical protein